MDLFRTIVDVPENKNKITYKDKVMFMGSCFTETIGQMLNNHKFITIVNPFGVIYNPASMHSCFDILLSQQRYTNDKLSQHDGIWFSYDHDTSFSSEDVDETINNINIEIAHASSMLKQTQFLFLTWGTAWVYKLKKTGKIVNNCHKVPADNFDRMLLDVDEIIHIYTDLLDTLFHVNKKLNIIISVSPVRHLKDGAAQNQISKAVLFTAINKLMKLYPNISYFPAYEIMMDELRDYRFYKNDMLHPNETATQYIWDRFLDSYLDSNSKSIITEIGKVISAVNHKPFKPGSKVFRNFAEKTLQLIESVSSKHKIDLNEERSIFQDYLKA